MSDSQEIKDRDAHNRQKVAEVLHKNFGVILVLVLLGLGGWGLYWGYGYWQLKQDQEARSEFYGIQAKIVEKEKDLYAKATDELATTNRSKENLMDGSLPEVPRTVESFDENYRILAEEMESLIGQHKGKPSASVSAMYLADLYLQYKLKDRAQGVLEAAGDQAPKGEVSTGLLKAQLAGLLSGEGQCEKALGLYEHLEDQASYKFMWPHVLLRKASCLIELGQAESAQATLDKIKAEYAKTEAGRMAPIYERVLRLKTKSGEK